MLNVTIAGWPIAYPDSAGIPDLSTDDLFAVARGLHEAEGRAFQARENDRGRWLAMQAHSFEQAGYDMVGIGPNDYDMED